MISGAAITAPRSGTGGMSRSGGAAEPYAPETRGELGAFDGAPGAADVRGGFGPKEGASLTAVRAGDPSIDFRPGTGGGFPLCGGAGFLGGGSLSAGRCGNLNTARAV